MAEALHTAGLTHRIRRTAREARALLARHDLFLLGAGVTFYSALAIPPLAFLTVRLLLRAAASRPSGPCPCW